MTHGSLSVKCEHQEGQMDEKPMAQVAQMLVTTEAIIKVAISLSDAAEARACGAPTSVGRCSPSQDPHRKLPLFVWG
jgi:hypothetical protein